jgi:hypothetical protein
MRQPWSWAIPLGEVLDQEPTLNLEASVLPCLAAHLSIMPRRTMRGGLSSKRSRPDHDGRTVAPHEPR